LAASLRTSNESEKFVPRRLFIKGFCNYGCDADEGISEASTKTAANSLLTHLKVEYRKFLAEHNGGIFVPRFRNSEITLLIRDGAPDDAAWLILKELKTVLEHAPMHINKRPNFIQADAELWKKQRRAGLAKASQAISDEYSNGAQVLTSPRIGFREPSGQTSLTKLSNLGIGIVTVVGCGMRKL
jgi:hypothetical protein